MMMMIFVGCSRLSWALDADALIFTLLLLSLHYCKCYVYFLGYVQSPKP